MWSQVIHSSLLTHTHTHTPVYTHTLVHTHTGGCAASVPQSAPNVHFCKNRKMLKSVEATWLLFKAPYIRFESAKSTHAHECVTQTTELPLGFTETFSPPGYTFPAIVT